MVNLLLRDGGEVPVLGEVLPNQPVRILVRSALPGCVGMSKVEIGLQFLGNLLMFGELLAVVRGQRMYLSPR